jgi:hypothetical protein
VGSQPPAANLLGLGVRLTAAGAQSPLLPELVRDPGPRPRESAPGTWIRLRIRPCVRPQHPARPGAGLLGGSVGSRRPQKPESVAPVAYRGGHGADATEPRTAQ